MLAFGRRPTPSLQPSPRRKANKVKHNLLNQLRLWLKPSGAQKKKRSNNNSFCSGEREREKGNDYWLANANQFGNSSHMAHVSPFKCFINLLSPPPRCTTGYARIFSSFQISFISPPPPAFTKTTGFPFTPPLSVGAIFLSSSLLFQVLSLSLSLDWTMRREF